MNMNIAINKVNKKIASVLSGGSVFLSELYTRSGLAEGKRLRAKMVFAFSGKESDKAVDMAASIEILHAATLIHDDVIDNSLLRRGHSALYREKGISESILYGDYLFSEALKLVSAFKDPDVTCAIVSALSEVLKGEILEQKRKGDMALTEEEYSGIIEMKSGSLFGVSARLGALMREHKNVNADLCYLIGVKAGMAYQMLDDYLDYFGRGMEKGKFNDIKEGIVTLPLIKLARKCSAEERNAIGCLLGQKIEGDRGAYKVTRLMDDYDIAADILDEIESHLEKLKQLFSEAAIDELISADESEILYWIKQKVDNARKEYSNSRRRVCRNKRSEAVK